MLYSICIQRYVWLLSYALVILYFTSFLYFLFLYIRLSGVRILFRAPLIVSKSGSLRRERRHFVPLFALFSWNEENRRFPNEDSQSGISRQSTGVPWPPEKGTFDADSCGNLAERRRWRKKVEATDATETEKTTEVLTDSLPSFPRVLTHTANERRSAFFLPSLLFGDAQSLRRYIRESAKTYDPRTH